MGLISLLNFEQREQDAVRAMIYLSRAESTASYGRGRWQPIFHRSNRKGKKYSVYTPSGKLVSFGSLGHDHYKDSTGLNLYSHLDHNDPERRRLYRARHSKILLKDGTPAYLSKEQPAFFSYHFLW